MFKEGWVVVNETPTHVQTWGGWIEDKITTESVIVCVTGNPGVTGFYSVFLSELHSLTGLPVWVINHAGLEFPPDDENMMMPSLNANPHLYDLHGQITHKLKFIEQYAGSEVKLYLIGHSAGAKMVTGLLKKQGIIPRVIQTYFLFPTLQHIGKSRFGKLHIKYGNYFMRVSLMIIWLFNLLPVSWSKWIITGYLKIRGKIEPSDQVIDASLKLLSPNALKAAFFLARDEMINIKDPDLDVLLSLGNRVNCYYGQTDGWAPLWQSEDIRQKCPEASVTVLDAKHKHAFVLSTPKEIAQLIFQHMETSRTP